MQALKERDKSLRRAHPAESESRDGPELHPKAVSGHSTYSKCLAARRAVLRQTALPHKMAATSCDASRRSFGGCGFAGDEWRFALWGWPMWTSALPRGRSQLHFAFTFFERFPTRPCPKPLNLMITPSFISSHLCRPAPANALPIGQNRGK